MRTRVKVCCIASIEEADAAVTAGADALGLVAHMPDGTGMLTDAEIRAITAHVPPPVSTVLLTSRTTASAISDHVRATQPTAVQVVRHIDPSEAAALATLEPQVRRVQVIHVEGPEVLALVSAYAPHVHAFLLDSGRPSAPVPRYGGTGVVHDWSISAEFVRTSPKPVFLAGGLDPSNVGDAIWRVRPFGLDLCSGVRRGGQLDAGKLALFLDAVRAADAGQAAA